MIKEEYKYFELTSKIIGCAMTVHSELSIGFQEVIYQRALEFEMFSQGIDYFREHEMPVYYKNNQIGTRRVDFLKYGIIAVELKAINYLEASDLDSNKKIKIIQESNESQFRQ
jgi:GxxExxY protein